MRKKRVNSHYLVIDPGDWECHPAPCDEKSLVSLCLNGIFICTIQAEVVKPDADIGFLNARTENYKLKKD